MDEWTPSEFPEAGADSSTLYSVFRRVGVVSAMDLIRPSVSPNDVGSYRAQDEELSSLFDEVDVAKKALSTLNDKMRAMPAILPAFEAAVTEAEEAVASRLDVLRSEALLEYFTECSSLISNGLGLADEFKRLVLEKVSGCTVYFGNHLY